MGCMGGPGGRPRCEGRAVSCQEAGKGRKEGKMDVRDGGLDVKRPGMDGWMDGWIVRMNLRASQKQTNMYQIY